MADYAKACLWALAGRARPPRPDDVRTILSNVFPTDIEIGPDGRLYFVDIVSGTLNRIDHFGGNQPPIVPIHR